MTRALVLGGSTGVGGVITTTLIRNGHEVHVAGKSNGSDFRTEEGLHDIWHIMRMIEPSYVVYNAGMNVLMPAHKLDGDITEKMYMVNVYGLLIALKEFARLVVNHANRMEGMFRFVHVGSVAATVPQTTSIAYCSSKAAARQATLTAARELGPLGAYVNIVAPGPISDTNMTDYVRQTVPTMRGWDYEYAEQYQMNAIPLRRRMLKSEVADTVAWLLSPDVTGITGAEIRVSGGL